MATTFGLPTACLHFSFATFLVLLGLELWRSFSCHIHAAHMRLCIYPSVRGRRRIRSMSKEILHTTGQTLLASCDSQSVGHGILFIPSALHTIRLRVLPATLSRPMTVFEAPQVPGHYKLAG